MRRRRSKDPAGRVFLNNESVCRTLSRPARQAFEAHRDSLIRALIDEHLLVPTALVRAGSIGLASSEVGEYVLQQPPIAVMSSSHAWSRKMRDAALTTRRILDRALASDFVLKDATAFDALFDGTAPRIGRIAQIVAACETHGGSRRPCRVRCRAGVADEDPRLAGGRS